ncbi:hypothetical protein GYH30_046711 [Glycine max]|uniref:Uncharacterized protein n=1 Tax=Glycine max TaxID=3847 RepID=K7MKQ7_SOYBN|nr:hypothetical protein GYH30_046711 [Glycine max]
MLFSTVRAVTLPLILTLFLLLTHATQSANSVNPMFLPLSISISLLLDEHWQKNNFYNLDYRVGHVL